MSDKDAESHDDAGTNDIDPWVQAHLSTHHLHWLEKQRGMIDPTEVLKFALAEWVARHPEEWFGKQTSEVPCGHALDEFITRHKEEFIPVE